MSCSHASQRDSTFGDHSDGEENFSPSNPLVDTMETTNSALINGAVDARQVCAEAMYPYNIVDLFVLARFVGGNISNNCFYIRRGTSLLSSSPRLHQFLSYQNLWHNNQIRYEMSV